MTKNKLKDLNDHLFAQLERLTDEDLPEDQIRTEINRSKACVELAQSITDNVNTQLKGLKMAVELGGDVKVTGLPPQLGFDGDEGGR